MRMALYVFIALLCGCNENAFDHSNGNIQSVKNDSIYVIVDSNTVDKKENSFDLVLIFETAEKRYEIHREKNQDHSVEFEYHPAFQNNNLHFEQYVIADLPTGRSKSVIWDKKTNYFYLTNWYDDDATGDTIINSAVNFDGYTAKVRNVDAGRPDYEVKLKRIR